MNEDQDIVRILDNERILDNAINENSGNNAGETTINVDDRTSENIINGVHRLSDSITGSTVTEPRTIVGNIHTTHTTIPPDFTLSRSDFTINRSGYVPCVTMSADNNNDIIMTNRINNEDGTHTEEQINISEMFREHKELKKEIAEIKEILKNHKEMFKTVNSKLNISGKITAMR